MSNELAAMRQQNKLEISNLNKQQLTEIQNKNQFEVGRSLFELILF